MRIPQEGYVDSKGLVWEISKVELPTRPLTIQEKETLKEFQEIKKQLKITNENT